jgi:hypothetical protein
LSSQSKFKPKVAATICVIALGAASVLAQNVQPTAPDNSEIVTDRPDVTESSIVVPVASLQFENGFTWTTDHGTQLPDLPETLVRLGILARTEFRFVVPNYLFCSGLASGGFGDLAIGMKQQFGPLPGGIDLSVIAAVSLPTGARGLSSRGYDPFVKFPWSKDLASGWSIGGMQSVFWNTVQGRRNDVWEPTFYLEKQITEPLDAFMEYAGDYAQRGGPKQLLHFGAAYKLKALNQVDFHFGFGLSHATPNHFFAVGYSVRFDKLWR